MTLPVFWQHRRPHVAADRSNDLCDEVLRFPLSAHGRLALVDSRFRVEAGMCAFAGDDIRSLSDFAPESIALPLPLALSLADQKLCGSLEMPTLRIAIVVVSSLGTSMLAPHQRDLLWKAFGLPVFEQLAGPDGMIIARECEVHEGLHCGNEAVIAEVERHFAVEILRGGCECGNENPRLHRLSVRQARAAAA